MQTGTEDGSVMFLGLLAFCALLPWKDMQPLQLPVYATRGLN